MALAFNSASDSVIGNLAMPESAGTWAIWFFPTDDTTRQKIFQHGAGGVGITDSAIQFRGDLAGDPIECYREGSTYADVNVSIGNFAAYALNTWMLLVWSWTTSTSKLYLGNLTLQPAEPSAYNGANAIVTPTTGTGNCQLGFDPFTNNRPFNGSIAVFAVYPTELTSSERYRLWRGEVLPGANLHWRLGVNGLTNVPDFSGNGNTGTIANLAIAAGLPRPAPFASKLLVGVGR